MARQEKTLQFLFEGPKDPEAFVRAFRRVLTDRLLAEEERVGEGRAG